ncbi:MAG: hypothetical protein VW955_04000 [Gammaproteobacteria bacterium]|jgi:hypothetical protein|nr:hypothetical protein [Gammaproteobacteria bacterium]|tara:strand:+ start:660 stop:953 length:294 start_codon:yes stop_codon:yes gene_type:complete
MFDGRIKRIIAFLKEKFTDETESSRQMLITYSDYLKGEADEESLERANQQLNEILKDLSFGLLAIIPFAPITIPMVAKFAKKHNIDLLPEWFKDSLK